jgi:hypothetical protein
MDNGTPMGSSGHITGKCPCGNYHGRRRYPQPVERGITPLTLAELVDPTNEEMNDWRVLVRAMPEHTNTPKGDDLA